MAEFTSEEIVMHVLAFGGKCADECCGAEPQDNSDPVPCKWCALLAKSAPYYGRDWRTIYLEALEALKRCDVGYVVSGPIGNFVMGRCPMQSDINMPKFRPAEKTIQINGWFGTKNTEIPDSDISWAFATYAAVFDCVAAMPRISDNPAKSLCDALSVKHGSWAAYYAILRD